MTTLAHDYYDDTNWSEDGRLAQAHLAGDPDAFSALYRRYLPDLVAYLDHRLHDHSLAEDLAQESIERALRFLPTFDPVRPLWPWLRTIASRIATAETVRRASEVPVDDVAGTTDATIVDATEAFVSRAAVEDCLARIPLRQRRALVLRYVEDRDPSDIAATFGLNRPAFEQLMWRARRNLAKEYRARNAAPWLPVWPVIQRLRRIVLDTTSRVSTAAGAGFSFAGDVAFGAAITGIGLGIATGVVGAPGTAHADLPTVVQADPGATDLPLRGLTPSAHGAQAVRARSLSTAVAYPTNENVVAGPARTEPVAAPPSGGDGPVPDPGTAATESVPHTHTVTPVTDDPVPTPQPEPPSTKVEGVDVLKDSDVPAAASAESTVDSEHPNQEGTVVDTTVEAETPAGSLPVTVAVTNTSDDNAPCYDFNICLKLL